MLGMPVAPATVTPGKDPSVQRGRVSRLQNFSASHEEIQLQPSNLARTPMGHESHRSESEREGEGERERERGRDGA